MLPPLSRIVSSWSPTTRLRMRCEVPKRRCGWRNQCGRMPSSDTRLRTPFDPTMDVFTAPASISVPTTATNPRNSDPQRQRPDEVHREAADRIVEEGAADRVGNDHHGEERDAGREDQAVDKDDEPSLFEVLQLRMFDLPIDLRHGLFAAHGEHRVAQANQNGDECDGVRQRVWR